MNCTQEPATGKLIIGDASGHSKQLTFCSQSHSREIGLNNQGLGHVPGTGPFDVHLNQALHRDTSGMNVFGGAPSQIFSC